MKNDSSININTKASNLYDNILQKVRADKGSPYTHTRIANKELNIYGGIFDFQYTDEFWTEYYNHVFVNKTNEYLTEKQLIEGPLLVDLDLKYNNSIKIRQHTKDNIVDLINLYVTKINEIYDIPDKASISVYVYEKPDIKILDKISKDGIHLVFTIKMHKAVQCILRKKIINDIKQIWDNIDVINSYDEVFDEGITKGYVNWQLYGSRKPGCDAYKLVYYYKLQYDIEEDDWDFREEQLSKINIKDHLPIMSARYENHPQYEIKNNEYLLEAIEKEKKELTNKENKKTKTIPNAVDLDLYDFSKISNAEELESLLESFLGNLSQNNYEIKETHLFAMVLPELYYGEGSYNKWIRVGWALKNTRESLFLTWMKLSMQSSSFDFRDIPRYYALWNSFEVKNADGLTNRSIMFWAKNDNYPSYINIRQQTISYYIDQTLESIIKKDKVTEFDLATVLYQLCKDQFICVNVKNNQWYEYKNNKWHEIDSGNTLRLMISRKMHDIYMKKADTMMETMSHMENTEQNADAVRTKSSKLGDICLLLKTTSWKNNIMKEAKDLFYDSEFLNKLDSNPYLLCFNNYIVDFKNKLYRKGKPDDYISKSTTIDYIPYDKLNGPCLLDKSKSYEDLVKEINQFILELFPNEELNRYMWEHLASVLIGTNDNQTFNIYTGSGCNGKSKLVELMGKCLGDYKATVPITLITQSRNNIGSTSPEIVQLVGVRYAVMQEPSKGEKINEGIMKEITGGDPIQGRALFKDTITFIPQFKLVVCTNVLFDIKTNDDGTWRRIRICDFMSKFNETPYENEEKFPKSNFPYQYKIDQKIDEKFILWGPVLMSMLVNLAFTTGGKVKDAKIVTSVSDKYREGQDYLTEFAKEKITRKRDGKIKKTEILEEFKNWYIMHYGRNNLPNGKEITEYMDKSYGKCNKGKWFNVEICYNNEDDDDDEDEEEIVEE